MYLINKYKINNKNDIKFHFNIYNKLLKKDNYDKIYDILNSDNDYDKYYTKLINHEYKDYNDMSNLIIYGPKGSGKKTLINILLGYRSNVYKSANNLPYLSVFFIFIFKILLSIKFLRYSVPFIHNSLSFTILEFNSGASTPSILILYLIYSSL